jgi:hypothetical protein
MFSFFRPAGTDINKRALLTAVLALKFFEAKADNGSSLDAGTVAAIFVGVVVTLACIVACNRRHHHDAHDNHHDVRAPNLFVEPFHAHPHHHHQLFLHGDHLHHVAVVHNGHMDDVDLHDGSGYRPPQYSYI